MNRCLRIVVADSDPLVRSFFQETLCDLGHEVVGVAGTGRELVAQCRAVQPDLVITDIQLPELRALDALAAIYERTAVPVIVVCAYHDPHLIERAQSEYVLTYLIKPIREADLKPAIAAVWSKFEEFQATRREVGDLRPALEDRKMIERAKAVLMARAQHSESDAFRFLQRLAAEKSRKLAEMAAMILMAEEALAASEQRRVAEST